MNSFIKSFLKDLYHKYNALLITLQERTHKNGVKYIFKDNGSDKLLVVFSGIGGDYNYRRSLANSSWDQLYIKDSWAEGLSYYLYEDGKNHPEELTSEFIEDFLCSHVYSTISSLGSSKGGAAAIYFGLKHKFDDIYSGACQYKVGNYIGIFHKEDGYYPKLMGSLPEELGIAILNDKYEKMVESCACCKTIIHLIYSTEEHTFTDDIEPLIHKLDECKIQHIDQVEKFTEHSMIGQYVSSMCRSTFK